ncbi:MAG: molybdopterin-dependent oxidoreductase, partial [Bacteriovoracaceae bacterium]|nr:molybdopterin-dependent oxidoreductase [Bacteriovoracaceae bacterium]
MKLSSVELNHAEASVGKNIIHDAGITHVTGESIYIDDRPRLQNEVDVFVIGAPIAHAEVLKVDFSEALKQPGILAIYDYRDLHHNVWGPIVEEQPLLVEKIVRHFDEPILIVAADSREAFEKAKKLVKFDFKLLPGIYSIDEAISQKTALYTATPFVRGDVDKVLKEADHVIKGAFECGGQEHFYLESQASIVYPMENGQLEVHASSQHPTETQHLVAHAIGLGFHEVVCVVKRMGGGFGGKESQAAPFAAYAGLVAHRLKRPARLILTKDEDMQMTGKRHPFKFFYEIGFSNVGKIDGLKVQIFSDAGAYADLSSSILERAMFHIDGSYFIPCCLIEGFAMRTNHLSNTAFRGFGGPQGNLCIEAIIEEVARTIKKDSLEIRKLNLYSKENGVLTPYGQEVEQNVLPELFKELELTSGYQQRLKEITEYNKESLRTKKIRSLSMTGCKFGIAFTARFLNQGNALVNLHRDGTVQVSTGATEMGQGVNTKIQQIVATALGLAPKNVKVMAT